MKQFLFFIIFYFVLFYYEKQVSGTALDNKFGETAGNLESLSGGRSKLLKGHINDTDVDRNVVRKIANILLYNNFENLNTYKNVQNNFF